MKALVNTSIAIVLSLTSAATAHVACVGAIVPEEARPSHLGAQVDPCDCSADLDVSGEIGFGDLLALLAVWGPCGAPCPQDLNDDASIDFADLLAVLSAWGPCPAAYPLNNPFELPEPHIYG